MLGFTRDVSKVATTPRTGQFACMSVGILIFFDDYASVLLAGETMRPLLDLLCVSREKLSFIVDATSAPIASVSFRWLLHLQCVSRRACYSLLVCFVFNFFPLLISRIEFTRRLSL